MPVIVLKGLVVREYYPQPEQRSMSDADIFVKAKDLNKSKKILIDDVDIDNENVDSIIVKLYKEFEI